MRIIDLLSEERAAIPPKPRNFVAKNAKMGGAGQHKDKKKAEKQGDVKHKKDMATMEAVEDRTSYQVAKVLFDHGIKYDPAREDELVKVIGLALVKELNMSPAQARGVMRDEDFLSDTMSELQHMDQGVAEGQVNELSKDTLSNYSDKADMDIVKKHRVRSPQAQAGDKAAVAKTDKHIDKRMKGIDSANSRLNKGVAEAGYNHGFGDPRAPKLGNYQRDMDDEANIMYVYDTNDGRLKQKMISNPDRRSAEQSGFKDSPEQALRAHNIIKSKFDPKKYVQNQGGKWVTVYPYGQKTESVEEGLDYNKRQQLIQFLAKKLDWDASHLELASDAELIAWYKNVQAGKKPMGY